MRPVVLLTDFGQADHYAGVLHGVLVREAPGVERVDLSHAVPAGDVWAAAYLLRYSEVSDPFEAARFACAAAALCVEAPGVSGVAGRAAIEARLAGGSGPGVLFPGGCDT